MFLSMKMLPTVAIATKNIKPHTQIISIQMRTFKKRNREKFENWKIQCVYQPSALLNQSQPTFASVNRHLK